MPEDFRTRIIISAKSSADKVFASTARASAKVVKSLGRVAAAGAAAGAATSAAFAVSSIKAAGTFQAGIAELGAITGATGKDLEFLADSAKAFGQASTFGATAAAEAFKLVASAKPDLLENAEALAATTGQVILLSEATGNTLAQSAETVGSALNQFGVEADQASRFVNVLAAGAKFGSSEVTDTAAALRKAGVAAASAGIDFETTNAAIQTLAGVGIKGAEAGTALRGVFLKLQTQANDDFNPAIVGVSAALENLSTANLDATELTKLFGQENFVAAISLIENRDKLEGLTAALTGTSVASEQAAKRQATFEAQTKLLKNAFEILQIEVGEKFLPVATDVVKIITQIIKEFTTATEDTDELNVSFETLDETIRTVVATFTSIKTVLEIVGKAIGGIVAAFVTALSGDFAQVDDILRAAFDDIEKTAEEGFASAAMTIGGKTPEMVKSVLTSDGVKNAARTAGVEIATSFFEGVNTPSTEAAATAAQAQLDALMQRVENIREGTLTEVEAENERIETLRGVIFQGKLAGFEDAEFFRELDERATAQHVENLRMISERSIKKESKFANLTNKEKTRFAIGQLQTLTAATGTEGKKQFRLNQAASLGNAIVNTAEAITNALDVQPFPVGLALAAVAAAIGAAQIAAIVSARPGGGATPSVSGGGASGGGIPLQSPANVGVGAVDEDEPGAVREINIVIQGLPEAGVMPAEAVRDLMVSINEELGDGANINVSGGSSGGT